METDDEKYLVPNHYAFLVTEDEFDAIFGRIQERGLDYYADPAGQQKGEINHHDGGRGRLLGRSRRPLAGDHHPPLRQRVGIAGPSAPAACT